MGRDIIPHYRKKCNTPKRFFCVFSGLFPDGEKSPALEKVNELLQSLEMRTFVTAIVERYGTEAFWFNVEKDGKKVKYRNKYRKTAISNDLHRWEDFLFEGVDNNPFVGTTDQSKADIEPDLFNVPVFTKPE